MDKAGKNDLKRLISATENSLAGLKAAWRNEAAFRLEILAGIVLIPAAFWLGETSLEWILLIGSYLLVLITELLNSAIEAVVDRIGLEHHELSGRAKDIGSAAVFLSLTNLLLVWVLSICPTLCPKIF